MRKLAMTDIPYRTALIVGAGPGISASVARGLSAAGLRVGLAARYLGPKGIHVAHFVIDGGVRKRGGRIRRTGRTARSIQTALLRLISMSCGNRAALGPWRSSCGRGSRPSEVTEQSYLDPVGVGE